MILTVLENLKKWYLKISVKRNFSRVLLYDKWLRSTSCTLRAELILQYFRHFTHVTTHSHSLFLHHSSFFNPSVASATSQFILQPLFYFFYVTSSSLNSPGEPPMERCLGFPDLWSGQKPWRNWNLTPLMNFGEVRRTQLAKSTLLTSTLGPLESF